MKAVRLKTLSKEWWKDAQAPPPVEPKPREVVLTGRYLTVAQVAERLNVGIWGIYDAIHSRDLDAIPVGKRGYRISEPALIAYLQLCAERRRA